MRGLQCQQPMQRLLRRLLPIGDKRDEDMQILRGKELFDLRGQQMRILFGWVLFDGILMSKVSAGKL